MDAWEFEGHARTLIFKAQGIATLASPADFPQHFISPSQIEMRRAVSSAYYAVFHRLTTAGSFAFAAAGMALRHQSAPVYNHTAMRKVCDFYARLPGKPLPPPLASLDPRPLDPRLISIARAFAQLQEGRHLVNCDLSVTIEFKWAAQLVNSAGTALAYFDAVQSLPETTVFLTALLHADRWSRRG